MKEILFLLIAVLLTGYMAQGFGYDFVRTVDSNSTINQSETVLMTQCNDFESNLNNGECENSKDIVIKPKRLSLTILVGFLFGGWLAAWYRRKWKGEFP